MALELLLIPILGSLSLVAPPGGSTQDLTHEQLIAERMLNQWAYSLFVVRHHADLTILKAEYDLVFDNIKSDSLRGELGEFNKKIMNALTQEKMNNIKREWLDKKLAKATQEGISVAVREAFVQSSVEAGNILTGNPLAIFSPLSVGASSYFDYYKQMQAEKDKYDEAELDLRTEILSQCNELFTEYQDIRVSLANENDLDDSRRPRQKDLKTMQDALVMEDASRRHKLLEGLRSQSSFKSFGPYWFHLAMAREAEGKVEDAIIAYSKYIDELEGLHLTVDNMKRAARIKRASLNYAASRGDGTDDGTPKLSADIKEDINQLIKKDLIDTVEIDLQLASLLAAIDPDKYEEKIDQIIDYWISDDLPAHSELAGRVELVLAAQVAERDPDRLSDLLATLSARSQEAVNDLQMLYFLTRDDRALRSLMPLLENITLRPERLGTFNLSGLKSPVLTIPPEWPSTTRRAKLEVGLIPYEGSELGDGEIEFEKCKIDHKQWRVDPINTIKVTLPMWEGEVDLHYRVVHHFDDNPAFELWWVDTEQHRKIKGKDGLETTGVPPTLRTMALEDGPLAGPLMEVTLDREREFVDLLLLSEYVHETLWIKAPATLELGSFKVTGGPSEAIEQESDPGFVKKELKEAFHQPTWDQSRHAVTASLGSGPTIHWNAQPMVENLSLDAEDQLVSLDDTTWKLGENGRWHQVGEIEADLPKLHDVTVRATTWSVQRQTVQGQTAKTSVDVSGIEVRIPIALPKATIRWNDAKTPAEPSTDSWYELFRLPNKESGELDVDFGDAGRLRFRVNQLPQGDAVLARDAELHRHGQVWHLQNETWVERQDNREDGDET